MARVFIPVPSSGESTPGLPNRIIARGMGPHQSRLVTRGYGGSPPTFVTSALRQINLGQSGLKRRMAELDEVIIWAKLVEINDKVPNKEIKSWIKVPAKRDLGFASVMAEHVSSRTRAAWERIKVNVKRVN